MAINFSKNNNKNGFALLITLIVVGVVVSIGLAVLDLSIKQVRLSTNAKDSEIAFHAATAGIECARYWRRVDSVSLESGANFSPTCFGMTLSSIQKNIDHGGLAKSPVFTGDGMAFFYAYAFTWGPAGQQRCTLVDTLVIVSDHEDSIATTVSNMQSLFRDYPSANLVCDVGSSCTVVSVRGYNKSCSTVTNPSTNYGTVEREVLLQY